MSGRAIIIVVCGIIIVAGIVLYNIEAASTGIVSNLNNFYSKQVATNIASTGVNMALTQLSADRTWRTGFPSTTVLNGSVTVTVFDTVYQGISYNCVGIRAIGTFNNTKSNVTAIGYFPPKLKPISVKGLLTLHSANQINGNIVLDGRDHDVNGGLLAGTGTYGVWTTGPSFTVSGSGTVGGTNVGGTDYAPSGTPNAGVIAVNQPAGGYFSSIDSAFGGAPMGYPPGTMLSLAKSGVGGSQYVTDPANIHYPLSGVTYVDLPPNGFWNAPVLNGSGVLIVHNADGSSTMNNSLGRFSGIVVADNIARMHGTVIGAVIDFATVPSGNVIGNGQDSTLFSNAAITNATSLLVNGSRMKVVAWWE